MKSTDLFGQNILLNFNGEDNYRTGAGGFFSILIIVIVAVFFQSNILSFLAKTNISADVQTYFDENPDRIQLNDDSFMFAIAIDQDNFTTNPYFNITIKGRTYQRFDNGTLVKYENYTNLIPCTSDRFAKIFQKKGQQFTDAQFTELGLGTWLCPDYGYKLTVGGRFTSEYFDFIKIEVSDCKNKSQNNKMLTWKPQCASQEEKDDYLAGEGAYRIRLYTTNTVVNPNKPADFVQLFLDDELFFSFVPQKLARQSDIYLKRYNLETDQSLLPVLEQLEEESLIVRADYRDIVLLGSAQDSLYTTLYLRRSPFTMSAARSFQKVDDLLSYLGGFANIVVVFLGFLVGFYNKQQQLIELANKVYDFNINAKNEISTQIQRNSDLAKRITGIRKKTYQPNFHEVKDSDEFHKMPSKTTPAVDENKSEPKKNNPYDTQREGQDAVKIDILKSQFQQEQEDIIKKLGCQSRKDYLITQLQGILSRGQPILFSIRFFFNQMMCGKMFGNKQCVLLEKAINKINEDLDIYVIIEKVKEINLLKELFLNKDQQILFNFTPKQLIQLNEMKHLPSRLDVSKNYSDNSSLANSGFGNVAQLVIKKQDKMRNPAFRAYYKVFKAYDRLTVPSEEPSKINMILTNKLGKEIQNVFEVSQFIKFDIHQERISNRIVYTLRKKLKKIRLKKCKIDESEEKSENFDVFSIDRKQSDEEEMNILKRQLQFKSHI